MSVVGTSVYDGYFSEALRSGQGYSGGHDGKEEKENPYSCSSSKDCENKLKRKGDR